MKFFYYAIVCVFLLLSCTSEKGADEQARTEAETGVESPSELAEKSPLSEAASDYSIKIEPQDGFVNTAFRLSSKNFELSDASIQWMAGGVTVGDAEDASFTPRDAGYGKGDTVQARAVIDGREVLSNIVKLKNAPPEFTKAKLMPGRGNTLYVDAAVNDADGDETSISYKWLKNGGPAGEGMRIDSPLKRGDRISITLIPFDGEDYGRRVVVDRKIENLPPMIAEDNKFNFNGEVFTHQVMAEDPDEDELTYSLKSGGENISIDSGTGIVTWRVPAGFTGNVAVTVSVTDGHGGESTRQLTFSINPAAKPKEKGASGNSPLEKGE